jgi:hypothetical protein
MTPDHLSAAMAEEESGGGSYAMGCTMISNLLVAMCTWHFINARDRDIRKNGWNIISDTTSIFTAVLIFSFSHEAIEYLFQYYFDDDFETKRYLNQAECVFWYFVMMGLLVHYACLLKGQEKRKKIIASEGLRDQKEGMKVALLFAHACGFTVMYGWGMVQCSDSRDYKQDPLHSALLIPSAFFKWFGILSALGILRKGVLKFCLKADPKEDKLVALFEDSIEDGENDIYGLAVSFLVVQSLRFKIGGTLPDALGDEDGDSYWNHSSSESIHLYTVAAGFIFCCVPVLAIIVQPIASKAVDIIKSKCLRTLESKEPNFSSISVLIVVEVLSVTERLIGDICINICLMAFANCAINATEWLISGSPLGQKDKPSVKVLVACCVSLTGYMFAVVLDKIGDMAKQCGKGGKQCGKQVRRLTQKKHAECWVADWIQLGESVRCRD